MKSRKILLIATLLAFALVACPARRKETASAPVSTASVSTEHSSSIPILTEGGESSLSTGPEEGSLDSELDILMEGDGSEQPDLAIEKVEEVEEVVEEEEAVEEGMEPIVTITGPEYGISEEEIEEESATDGDSEEAVEESTEEAGDEVPTGVPSEITWLALAMPTPPDIALAKYRHFWLGMTIENWARFAIGPEMEEEGDAAEITDAAGESTEETIEGSTETEPGMIFTETEPDTPEASIKVKKEEKKNEAARPKPRPLYRELPLVVPVPGVTRFIYTDPTDMGIDHIIFRFFKDELAAVEVYYRSGYYDPVILDDFLERIKYTYGEPASEEWRKPNLRGVMHWDDGTNSIKLTVFNGRPFSLKLVHSALKQAEADYTEELKKEESGRKVEKVKF